LSEAFILYYTNILKEDLKKLVSADKSKYDVILNIGTVKIP